MPSNKRKRSGPGLSFADRDARSGAPSTSNPNAGNNGGAGKRTNYNQPYRLPSKLISGPGIFVTCVQGKERKAALQFIDHLNEVADRIYKDVKLLPPLKREEKKKKEEQGQAANEEDLMDAMRNGPAPSAANVEEEEELKPKQEEEEMNTKKEMAEEEKASIDDIEAQIQAELAELRGGSSSAPKHNKKARTEDDGKAKGDATPTQRFKKIETDTECLIFVSCARPIDPFKMVYAILEEVESTGEPRSRFVQRLSPVTDTCSAHPDQVAALAERVIPTFFPVDGPARSFKIDPRIRSHNTLTRDSLIQIVASAIPRQGGHYADLKKPDAWIIVEVHKNVCAIGVVEEYERYKKLNVQSVAEAAIAKRVEAQMKQTDEHTKGQGRVAGSLRLQAVSAPATAEESAAAQVESNVNVVEPPLPAQEQTDTHTTV